MFHSRDGGRTWKVTAAPIPAAEAGGVFSLAFRNPREGVMVGGDFTAPANGVDASGFTRDGGPPGASAAISPATAPASTG